MAIGLRRLVTAGVLVFVLAAPHGTYAQAEPYNFKFNAGQNIQPIFEGWAWNPDGSIGMYFGYLNRNYAEELIIPVGADNRIEPAGPDRGQPTFFYPRIQRLTFKVNVPKDWGKQKLTWTLTVRGKTEKAIGWLQPEWEIDPIRGGSSPSREALQNKAPTLAGLDIPPAIAASIPVTLTATIADDGLPTPRKPGGTSRALPPTLQQLPGTPETPVNVPSAVSPDRRSGGTGGCYCPQGQAATWTLWRGPAAVTFEPNRAVSVTGGKAAVTATFSKPGTYLFKVRASDGSLWEDKDVSITVNVTQKSSQP